MRLTLIIFVFALWCCSGTSNKKDVVSSDSSKNLAQTKIDTASVAVNDLFELKSYLDDQKVDTASLQTIDYRCALVIDPTDEQIQEMKKKYGEDDFYTMADDGNYYQATATKLLDSLGIKTVWANKPFVRFIGANKVWTLNLGRKGLPVWNLILFNKNKEPKIVGTAGLTTEAIDNYFKTD
jgi:hypothetical protein